MKNKTQKPKMDLHEIITNRFIEALEKGTNPWTKPWKSTGAGDAMTGEFPVNIASGKRYQGINTLMLWMEANAQGFHSTKWGTFKQWQDKGATVQKGQKGTPVVYWGVLFFEHGAGGKLGKKLIPGKPYSMKELEAMAGAGRIKKVMYEKYSTAFNQDQTDLKEEVKPEPAMTGDMVSGEEPEFSACQHTVSRWIGEQGIGIHAGTNRAFYNPRADKIGMPYQIQFNSPAEFYHTYFHEMAHSTGHTSRLDRLEPATFGSDPYAKEELVAELTASFLSNAHGIFAETEENSKAYFKNWADVLKADKKLIFKASREAQKAFDLIMNA
jgi:antirestriction protein ArdC